MVCSLPMVATMLTGLPAMAQFEDLENEKYKDLTQLGINPITKPVASHELVRPDENSRDYDDRPRILSNYTHALTAGPGPVSIAETWLPSPEDRASFYLVGENIACKLTNPCVLPKQQPIVLRAFVDHERFPPEKQRFGFKVNGLISPPAEADFAKYLALAKYTWLGKANPEAELSIRRITALTSPNGSGVLRQVRPEKKDEYDSHPRAYTSYWYTFEAVQGPLKVESFKLPNKKASADIDFFGEDLECGLSYIKRGSDRRLNEGCTVPFKQPILMRVTIQHDRKPDKQEKYEFKLKGFAGPITKQDVPVIINRYHNGRITALQLPSTIPPKAEASSNKTRPPQCTLVQQVLNKPSWVCSR